MKHSIDTPFEPMSSSMGKRRATTRRAMRPVLTRRTIDDETGIGLIEVIVSALLLVLVASGVYLGLDAASATSGTNKRRSLATGVAQQDQDRMRAMAVAELSNFRDERRMRVGAIEFTVRSSASWVTDGSGTASCTAATARTSYLRIASSVTWAGMTIKPVGIESVIAPPNGSFGTNLGSLAVEVRDRDGLPVPGAAVTLTGPRSYTDTTNSLGCVLWGYLPAGSYAVAVAKPGYVSPEGVAQPSRAVGVVGETTATAGFDYDRGGQVRANYTTWNGTGWVTAAGAAFTIQHPRMTVALPPVTSDLSGLVYPFPDPYSVYAGSCPGADPLRNGQPATTAAVPRGGVASVDVRLASLGVKVVNGTTPRAGATLTLTGTGAGCGPLPPRATGSDGYPADRAVPLGSYSLCVADVGTVRTVALDASDPRVARATSVDMAGAPRGTCP